MVAGLTGRKRRMCGTRCLKSSEKFGKLAEGYYTVEALMELSKKYGVDMPISRAVHKVLYDGANPRDELTALFMRSLKKEF